MIALETVSPVNTMKTSSLEALKGKNLLWSPRNNNLRELLFDLSDNPRNLHYQDMPPPPFLLTAFRTCSVQTTFSLRVLLRNNQQQMFNIKATKDVVRAETRSWPKELKGKSGEWDVYWGLGETPTYFWKSRRACTCVRLYECPGKI